MYTVMLLDDEPWELKGLQRVFPWEEYGFHVEYTLGDSMKARDILLSQQIDVLFSDIRMPALDGIGLLKSLWEHNVSTEIVFISGYAEFEYAQQAIRLGAFDYLLKPVDLDETAPLLQKLQKKLEYKKHIQELTILDSIMDNSISFYDLFHSKQDASFYCAMFTKEGLSDEIFVKEKDVKKLHLMLAPNKHLYILKLTSEPVLLIEFMKDHVTQTIGLSNILKGDEPSENQASLSEFISQAETAYNNEFITGKKALVEYYDSDLLSLKNIINEFQRLYEANDLIKLKELLDTLPEYFIAHSINVNGVLQFWNQVLLHIITDPEVIAEYNYPSVNQLMESFDSLKDLCCKLYQIIETITLPPSNYGTFDQNSRKIYSNMVEYINNNYKNSITLQDVADEAHINFTYACKIFKKYSNSNYSKYITDLRIKDACQLLATTSLSTEEICFQLGYSDYFYFNKVFKKYIGLTPYQYRMSLVKNN
jgi:YesN/AraC family two-component response regulator